MCELFGLSCNYYDRAIKSLPIFAQKGSWCRDGWGLGFYRGRKAFIEKHPEEVLTSMVFKDVIEKAKSNIIVAHVRFATKGKVCKENCHPFKINYLERDWIFVHNGSISSINYQSRVNGDSDSAQVFSFLMDKIEIYLNSGRIKGIYPAVLQTTKEVFNNFGRHINLNYILTDSNLLYVFSHYDGKNLYFLKRDKPYGGVILISTIKLTDENWQVIPKDRMLVVSGGEILVLSNRI